MTLYSLLRSKISAWRVSNYKSDFTALSEIFDFNFDSKNQSFRFLRKAQFEALETYWYLRIVERNPHIFDLYKKYFSNRDLLDALNIKLTEEDWQQIALNGGGLNAIFKKIVEDDDFVRKYRLEA
ncbi:MAG: hypothetical protein ABIL20_07535, partial [candidate division WOR-3 bacterium]